MADRKRDRQAKIQAQALNPVGASLTADEGGSFVDRCSLECVSNESWKVLLQRHEAACFGEWFG